VSNESGLTAAEGGLGLGLGLAHHDVRHRAARDAADVLVDPLQGVAPVFVVDIERLDMRRQIKSCNPEFG